MIDVAVVGTGGMARRYCERARRSRSMRLAGAMTETPGRAAAWAAEIGAPVHGGAAELARIRPGLVVIASAPARHAAQAEAFLDLGLPVLCEKPVTTDPALMARLVEKARSRGVRFGCVLQRRLDFRTAAARAALASGSRGALVSVEAKTRMPRGAEYYAPRWKREPGLAEGGALANQGIHLLDWLVHLLGPVSASEASLSGRGAGPAEDDARLSLRFASGVRARFSVTTAADAAPGESVRFLFERGEWAPPAAPPRWAFWRPGPALPEDALDEFAEALAGGRPSALDAESTLETHRLIGEAYARREAVDA